MMIIVDLLLRRERARGTGWNSHELPSVSILLLAWTKVLFTVSGSSCLYRIHVCKEQVTFLDQVTSGNVEKVKLGQSD